MSIILIFRSTIKINHPLSLALSLISLCLALRFLIIKISFSWLFFLLVLIFLGGVIIVIVYMCSLAANEKSFFAPFPIFFVGLILASLLFNMDTRRQDTILSRFLFSGERYSERFTPTLVFCFLLLLLAMISVVKLMKLEAGPLVKRL